jgi:predicted ABC-type ATPase
MAAKPNLYVIAGPNGSGKTTFVRRFLPHYAECLNFVNADLIASGLSPFSPEIAAIKAGKIMLEQINDYGKKGSDFAFETTLSGKTHIRLLKDLKMKGYKIHLYFLWLKDVELAVQRVAERVTMGGHAVPLQVIKRRFGRGLSNLFNVYRPLLDSWIMFDNSTDEPRIIAHEKDGILTVTDSKLFDTLRKHQEAP